MLEAKKQTAAQPTRMTETEWREMGSDLFGEDLSRWQFLCPTCGHTMSVEKARALPEEDRQRLRSGKWAPEQECVGRYIDQGCNWCAYGLFCGPHFVVRNDGSETPVFGFATQGDDHP